MTNETDAPDGFAMAEAVLEHAHRHFLIVLTGMDHSVPIWDDAQGNPTAGIAYYSAQDIGGEIVWQIEIKHCLEDIRSALDYTAFEVYERVCCREPKTQTPHVHDNVSFPIPRLGEKPEGFAARIDSFIPGLSKKSGATSAALIQLMAKSDQLNGLLRSLEENWNIVKHRHLPIPVAEKARVVATALGDPADHPVTERRLFSVNPPSDVETTLRYSIVFSREIVQTLRKSLAPGANSPAPRRPSSR